MRRLILSVLLLLVACLSFGQSGYSIGSPAGAITGSQVPIASIGAFTGQNIPTSILGGPTNVVNNTIVASWVKIGILDMATGAITPIPQNTSGGAVGWTAMNPPTGAGNNSYSVDQGTTTGGIIGSFNNVDGFCFGCIAQTYTGNNQYGEFGLQFISTNVSGVHTLLGVQSFVLGGQNESVIGGLGGTDPTTETNTGNTATNTGATATNTAATTAAVNTLAGDVTAGTTATVSAINAQNSNQGGFWQGLFVPSPTTLVNLQNALSQFESWGPFQMVTNVLTSFNQWRTGGLANAVPYRITLGNLPVYGTLIIDLTPYQDQIRVMRDVLAGVLWVTFLATIPKYTMKILSK